MRIIAVIALVVVGAPPAELSEGMKALEEFRLDDAIPLLEAALARGGQSYEAYLETHEQLGIAYAYKGRAQDALAVFLRLLALDPSHAIAYDLSPKATLIFAEARAKLTESTAPNVDVTWPRDRSAADPLPIEVEVVADPEHLFKTATLYHRRQTHGAAVAEFEAIELAISAPGSVERVVLPPPRELIEGDVVREVYLAVRDAAGNEVHRWASRAHPREIVLRFRAPEHWYGQWWVWAIGGVVVAAGSAAGVFALTRAPSNTFGVDAEVRR